MNIDNDEIENLIRQLQELQLQQTELLARLERASHNQARANRNETRSARADEVQAFTIGDTVRIKNPSRFQSNAGSITKIGTNRITVRTKSGKLILRAPKNLIKEDE
jgi:transcription antitermination factor NusG